MSVFLISFSYLTNQWLIGIFVLLIHDVSDLVYALARFYKALPPLCRTTATAASGC